MMIYPNKTIRIYSKRHSECSGDSIFSTTTLKWHFNVPVNPEHIILLTDIRNVTHERVFGVESTLEQSEQVCVSRLDDTLWSFDIITDGAEIVWSFITYEEALEEYKRLIEIY